MATLNLTFHGEPLELEVSPVLADRLFRVARREGMTSSELARRILERCFPENPESSGQSSRDA